MMSIHNYIHGRDICTVEGDNNAKAAILMNMVVTIVDKLIQLECDMAVVLNNNVSVRTSGQKAIACANGKAGICITRRVSMNMMSK
jgi:hypothetical protein